MLSDGEPRGAPTYALRCPTFPFKSDHRLNNTHPHIYIYDMQAHPLRLYVRIFPRRRRTWICRPVYIYEQHAEPPINQIATDAAVPPRSTCASSPRFSTSSSTTKSIIAAARARVSEQWTKSIGGHHAVRCHSAVGGGERPWMERLIWIYWGAYSLSDLKDECDLYINIELRTLSGKFGV